MQANKLLRFMGTASLIVGIYDVASAQAEVMGIALCVLGIALFAVLMWRRR